MSWEKLEWLNARKVTADADAVLAAGEVIAAGMIRIVISNADDRTRTYVRLLSA